MNKKLHRELIDRQWSEEGARFIAERVEREDSKFSNWIKRRLLGERTPRQRSDKRKAYIPNRLRKQVFERDRYRCRNCSDWHDLSVDHIIPESKGGTTTLDNLQTLCMVCNMEKGVG